LWLDEYKELMFCFENDDKKTIKAVKLKNENMPEFFYKYRTGADNTMDAFDNDILFFSALSMLNDPFECAMSLSYTQINKLAYDKILAQLRPFLKPDFDLSNADFSTQDVLVNKIVQGLRIPNEDQSSFKNLWRFTDDLIRAKISETAKETSLIGEENYRVCSFSELNDSLLMWAHYANNHQGFCIGYNFREAQDNLTDLMLPVIYSDDLLEISKYMFPNINKSLVMNAITRKSKAWEYEKEWRILMLPNNNNEKKQPQKVPIPKSVFLGTRISENVKNRIIEIALKKNIAIYQMHMGMEEFKLYSERINV
jgi:hypothetical protein